VVDLANLRERKGKTQRKYEHLRMKTIKFNLRNQEDKQLHEFTEQIDNFQGYVKELLKKEQVKANGQKKLQERMVLNNKGEIKFSL
jgi:hypothetical protein